MHIRRTLVLATLICLGGAAQAADFGGGPAYGGRNSVGGSVTCRVFNFGTTAVSISFRQIFDNTGAMVTLTSDSCNVSLGPTKSCSYSAPISGNLAFSCRLRTVGTGTGISGLIEIQSVGNTVLTTVPLRTP
jgi:hypothetical protein